MSEQHHESNPSSLSESDIAKIAAVVAATLKAMPATPVVDTERLGEVIGEKVAGGIVAAQPPRKVTNGEFIRRIACKAALKNRVYIENGRRIEEHLLSRDPDDTEFVDLLNRVTRSGVYFDGLVTVNYNVQPGGRVEVAIKWPCADPDKRRDVERQFGKDGVRAAWRQIVAEQEVLDREEAEAKKATEERRKYAFGAQRDIQRAVAAARAEAGVTA